MIVIPAVDIRGGRCVRLIQGDFDQQTVYGADPLEMARHWEAQGAKMLHIVDLDGAKDGQATNLEVIHRIAAALPIPIEVGGGIRTAEAAVKLIGAGVSRVIIGTMAFEDREALKRLLAAYGPKIVVALETKNGELVTRGWQHAVAGGLVSTALELQSLGVRRFLYTDVSKDGTLTEPNYVEIKRLLDAISVPVIASGGVSTQVAIAKLASLGVEEAIVGKALYEGTMSLREATSAS